jgi:hypothetical protein
VRVLGRGGDKGVLVEQHQFRVIGAGFRELWKLPSDCRDQAGLSLQRLSLAKIRNTFEKKDMWKARNITRPEI